MVLFGCKVMDTWYPTPIIKLLFLIMKINTTWNLQINYKNYRIFILYFLNTIFYLVFLFRTCIIIQHKLNS